ncbi:hypothetical protein DTO166G4_8343 [Paecilomyces variotii]|nr:hypothetical protein DTO166G4_8343 [Paecilomyces variotii]KAJ9250429.1 hypothetical protein DTO195F2_8167 [Paecilomyces variotii]KAJ9257610.1 hypothetical protein DTO207G8_1886 [Paecilomyces variotii]KAJ9283964.1 hypothetical protein DTO021C3_8428 [Paecilomyces variotii]KAJ9372530.1 hypothetical protein DTO282E5_2857 [Paecilomyces variotii]
MAPKKGGSEKVPGENGSVMILDYLRKQNRPYSAIEISTNLKNKVTKANAVKILKDMHEKGQIEGRAAGKQLVYHALQDPTDDVTPEALARISDEIEQLEKQLADYKNREKGLKSELSRMGNTVSFADLEQNVSKLEDETRSIHLRLKELCNDNTAEVSMEEKAQTEKEWKMWQRHAAVRERICRHLWERCTEVMSEDTTKEELWESLGLEGSI